MNKIIPYMMAVFFVLSAWAYAAEQPGVNDIIIRMTKALNLTDEQVGAIRPIIKEDVAKRQEFFQSIEGNSILDKPTVKSTMEKLQREKNQKLAKILTLEQMKKWMDKENLRKRLNPDQMDAVESQDDGGATLSPSGPSGATLAF